MEGNETLHPIPQLAVGCNTGWGCVGLARISFLSPLPLAPPPSGEMVRGGKRQRKIEKEKKEVYNGQLTEMTMKFDT